MTSHKILFTLSVLIASYGATAQYETYEDSEEESEHGDERPREDYSKYFGGLGVVASPAGPAQAADRSAGFVQPLDFTGIFNAGHFGLDGLAGGASHQVLNTPVGTGIAIPSQPGVFQVSHNPVTTNTSGFVNEIKFPSLFDSSGSGSENGFRPQDFLQQEPRPETTSPVSFYSPSFSTLQRDVDGEVDYQRKEQDKIERSRAGQRSRADARRDPEYGSEEDDEDADEFDSFEFDDGPETEYRSPPKQSKQPLPVTHERKQSIDSPKREGASYKTPYSSVNHVNLQGPSQTRPATIAHKRPLPSLPEYEDDNNPQINYQSKQRGNNNVPPINDAPQIHYNPRPRVNTPPIQPSNSPQQFRQPIKPYYQPYKTPYQRPLNNEPVYNSAQLKSLPATPQVTHPGTHYRFNNPHVYFRPSSGDPYFDNPKLIPKERRNYRPKQQDRENIHSLPQTEYATVVERTAKTPTNITSKNKKECKKISKKIDPNDFARFKRQQMTCYICTNKEKGNTYEECTYESDPKPNSFYKESAEAYSSDTILTPTTYTIRKRRSTTWGYDSNKRPTQPQVHDRKARQFNYEYGPEEQGHGQEHYRFGPEYFQQGRERQNVKKKPRKPVKRTDYDEDYYEDEESDEDVEKEYLPPGASKNDDCHKVNRNGIICMVCQKPNGRGTYEQCSYASDPESNKYEYAKSSSYGSKRPQNNRNKRYLVNEKVYRKKHKRNSQMKRYPKENKIYPNRRGDFRNGKLKRKKVIKGDYRRPSYQSANDKNNANASNEDEDTKIVGLDSFFYGSSETYNPDDYDERGKKIKRRNDNDEEAAASSTEDEGEDAVPTYEDSFHRLFPELAGTDPYTGETVEKKVKEKEAMDKRDDFEHSPIPDEEVEDEEESESVQNNRKVKPGFQYGVDLPDYYFNDDDTSKKDLEKTLDEFTHKNRSDCKKVMKDKMTCYQCINKNGLQHEECMFVAASEPKSKHLAYHEVKEFRIVPTDKSLNDSANINSEIAPENSYYEQTNKTSNGEIGHLTRGIDNIHPVIYKLPKKIKKLKKEEKLKKLQEENMKTFNTARIDGETLPAVSHDILKIRPKEEGQQFYALHVNSGVQREKRDSKNEITPRESRIKRKREKPKEDHEEGQTSQPHTVKPNYNAVPPDPEGFDEREGPEGAYSHETEPVYDKVLKITLPRYMLTRSEHEDIFDEVLSDLSLENLKYLSSEQALADLAYFITSMNQQHKLPPDTKWVAFGGSYAGNLAAWVRYKYPHLVYASVASSAPVLAEAYNFTSEGISLLLVNLGRDCLLNTYENEIKLLKNMDYNSSSVGMRQWEYQACTEFGYFPGNLHECEVIFGQRFNEHFVYQAVNRTNMIYGGLNIKATRVIYVNGSLDLWRKFAITKTRIPESPAIYIKGS